MNIRYFFTPDIPLSTLEKVVLRISQFIVFLFLALLLISFANYHNITF